MQANSVVGAHWRGASIIRIQISDCRLKGIASIAQPAISNLRSSICNRRSVGYTTDNLYIHLLYSLASVPLFLLSSKKTVVAASVQVQRTVS